MRYAFRTVLRGPGITLLTILILALGIGANTTIGGNVWLTESVPANTRVMLETPKLVYK